MCKVCEHFDDERIKNSFGSDSYFIWLSALGGCEEYDKEDTFFRLFRKLHEKEFYWSVPNDDNRCKDGLKLREVFISEQEFDMIIDGPCTVLEMLIALAIRCENDIMHYEKNGDRSKKWFWIMIENLGLHDCTDAAWDIEDSNEIDITLEVLLNREFDFTGKNGLFPLKNAKNDQRKVEIWYQMSAFLLENYCEGA